MSSRERLNVEDLQRPPWDIHGCACKGYIDGVKWWLSKRTDVDCQDLFGDTALHKAVSNDNRSIVECLLDYNANVEARNNEGYTTLHKAVWHGKLRMVECLLDHNANIEARNNENVTALVIAVRTDNFKIVKCLLYAGADMNTEYKQKTTILLMAVKRGDKEFVEWLIERNVDVKAVGSNGDTALHIAASEGELSVAECLLKHNANIEASNNQNVTSLDIAVAKDNFKIVKCLLYAGADTAYKQKTTVWHMAVTNGDIELIEWLIERKFDVNAVFKNNVTSLDIAVAKDNFKIVKCLLYAGADTAYKQKTTVLHMAVTNGDIELIEWLIERKFDVNAVFKNGDTALHIATSEGKLSVVECLLDHNANIEAINNKNVTSLDIAVGKYNFKIVKCLLYAGADINTTYEQKTTVLHMAVTNGDIELIEWLIERKFDVNAVFKNKYTALHLAALEGTLSVVECLLDHNANIEARNNQGDTALHIAASEGKLSVAECLLKRYANIEASNKQRDTPLHLCVLTVPPLLDLATTLVINGADIFLKNAKKETPYDIAARSDIRREILRMFKRELRTGLPKEMRYLRVGDVDSFKEALRSGYYYSYLGKIMIVGNEGVGKTAITAIIIGKQPPKWRKPTEGIDVHIWRAAVDLESKKLIPKELSVDEVAYRNLVMRKRYGGTSIELNTDDTLIDDDDDEEEEEDDDPMVCPNDEINVQEGAFEKDQNDGLKSDHTNPTTSAPITKKNDPSCFTKILMTLGLVKKDRETITTDMLKEGTIKAGKKGIHAMNLAPVIILDFAGQRVFYSTHQSFLTHRGIYVLTVNGSLLLDDVMTTESPVPGKYGKPTTRAYIEFWVSSILTYSKGRNKMFPKILIACTHKDLVPVDEIYKQRAYIYGEIIKMFVGTSAMDHLVLKHQIFVNAMDPSDPEVEVLKDALAELMFKQPSWGEKIPKSWIHLEMMINKEIASGEQVLHRKQLEEINRENPLQILSEKSLEVFLKVHHSQGDIIYFPLPGLRDHIIIYPAYLVDALKSIVTDKRFCDGKRLDVVNTMNNEGILKKADIAAIWQTNKKFQHHTGYLISLMSHLDIFSEPRKYHTETGKLLHTDFFFVPSLVTKKDLTDFGTQDNLCKRSLGLSFTFHSTVLPSAVGFRFISCCVEMYDVAIYQNQRMLFSGMVVVDINKSLKMLVQVKKQRVDIFLIHDTSRFQIIPDIATDIRECLHDTLYRISDSYKLSSAGTDVEIGSLPFHIEYPCHHIESPCYTQQRERLVCTGHKDDLGDTMKWFVDRTIEECAENCQGVSKGALDETPSDLQLAKLVLEMSWDDLRPMLLHLGMKQKEIKAIELDYSNNILNVMFVCLRKWRMKSRNRTLKDLYTAIEASGSNTHALCKVFRDKPFDLQLLTCGNKTLTNDQHENILRTCMKTSKDAQYDFLEQEPSDKDLDRLATHAVDESLLLTVQLYIDASYWLQMKEDGHKIVKINREILRKWRDEHRGKRKMRELGQAGSNVGINISFILSDFYNED